MLIYTIPPAMRCEAGAVLLGHINELAIYSSIDGLLLEDTKVVHDLSNYILKTFTRSLDAVLTARLLNIEPTDAIFSDTIIDKNNIKFHWQELKGFFKDIEADPESKLDLVLMQAYDESYDKLIDSDDWLTLLDTHLYKFAEDALSDLDELFKMVDESMPNLIQYVEQQKIEYASFDRGIILFS